MKIVVITSCTGRKRHACADQLVRDDFRHRNDAAVFAVRESHLEPYRTPAEELYTGEHHLRMMEGVRTVRERFGPQSVVLWIVSAGYGMVSGNQAICQPVTVGLVGMHIIAKNPKTGPKTNPDNGELLPQWIWATFEHVDNAPLAQAACDPTIKQCNNFGNASCGAATVQPKVRYSYFNPSQASSSTNVAPTASTSGPAFAWNNGQPYALGYTPPQAARCWQIYSLTQELNQQWQRSLHSARSVFANYMLVGTQWGASLEPTGPSPMPLNAVPGMLSNVTLETYIQNYAQPTATAGPGSCISCHSGATLLDGTTSANFSFLPGLASPTAARNIKR